jgi:hypothetical protein
MNPGFRPEHSVFRQRFVQESIMNLSALIRRSSATQTQSERQVRPGLLQSSDVLNYVTYLIVS